MEKGFFFFFQNTNKLCVVRGLASLFLEHIIPFFFYSGEAGPCYLKFSNSVIILTSLAKACQIVSDLKTKEIKGEFTSYFLFSYEFSKCLNIKNLSQHKIQPRNIY